MYSHTTLRSVYTKFEKKLQNTFWKPAKWENVLPVMCKVKRLFIKTVTLWWHLKQTAFVGPFLIIQFMCLIRFYANNVHNIPHFSAFSLCTHMGTQPAPLGNRSPCVPVNQTYSDSMNITNTLSEIPRGMGSVTDNVLFLTTLLLPH